MGTEMKPFSGLRVVTTDKDEDGIKFLLSSVASEGITCTDCSSKKFRVKAVIETELVISKGDNILVCGQHDTRISVTNILKCQNCGCTDYIKEVKRDEIKPFN